jgi:hypothetical protein
MNYAILALFFFMEAMYPEQSLSFIQLRPGKIYPGRTRIKNTPFFLSYSISFAFFAVANQNKSNKMTRIFSLLIVFVLAVSCGQQTRNTAGLSELEASEVTVEELLADAGPFVEQPVSVKGTVVHVCRHGGQRLFIVGEDGENRFRITVGENISEFDIELEGSVIEVNGIVKELIIDETYLAEWEAEAGKGPKLDRGEGHEGGVGHGDNHGEAPEQDTEEQQASQLQRIQQVRNEIAASGRDHLSDYWIETIDFKVISE